MAKKRDVWITEVALRDGSHAIAHQYTVDQVVKIAKALDEANVPYIEVAHGDGLAGSSLQYGLSRTNELELIEAAVSVCKQSKIAVLLLPGIGTMKDLQQVAGLGAKMARIATHVTEADVSAQHIGLAKELGMETVGFLMMAHMAPVEKLVEQAKLMESYGADAVYVVDSAGALLPHEVRDRIRALKQHVGVEIGFHGHNNLSLAMANSLVAIEEGATRIDGSVRCLGAGAGNTQTEVLVAVLDRLGVKTGIDLYKMMDLAEEIVAPMLPAPQEITRDSLVLGYAGVYSSFLLHARRIAEKLGMDARDILVELGKRKVVGGQEDMIVDVAVEMAKKRAESLVQ
ncbi:4-hydroxy-2-oxovalerate aldolase [Parageobacillus thermoglucosidasius]|uniref:4-hydroxy-2-oxovalerate aldolase n=2 Tax=Parageobacillus thermoglucosidasius TaxID=1426 RepID=A0AAN0YRU7_PARTM|nr:4-hydroxy-2-oxovalerate aldolase [Parageobacillus thermoglucosidasius]ANZ32273.1 4-hydroxy-2-oxovalerate aldolase [Parageobacillus thermoglucosidasius]APM83008.1 4-hydroxy-2-oxovalerate aldolase [Parageobacillus thermoglucosidasius]KJX67427.1 4-hydroxy-2-oxopentanoic acid aldolase [Parageobacillus thermoglucosidasius]RDE18612.1 4-hydroxy-2-oxovalerate aldolase [Parageobacillus thermoglucosidasius]UOE78353.1 4-hydroxy-2-oxovalerate aldolase [Parageobacillus thermoglucosidasius]